MALTASPVLGFIASVCLTRLPYFELSDTTNSQALYFPSKNLVVTDFVPNFIEFGGEKTPKSSASGLLTRYLNYFLF